MSVEADGPKHGEPYNVTMEEWEEQHWNKTRGLREVRASRPSTEFLRIPIVKSYFFDILRN